MAPYPRLIGAILAFLAIGVFVKYSELLFTFEHREWIGPENTIAGRAQQVWLALRFAWQEFAIAAGLLAAVLAWRRLVPTPGRGTRAGAVALQAALAIGGVLSVLGIAYYAVYHTHATARDFEHIGWAREIAGSAHVFQYMSTRIGLAMYAVLVIALPWISARIPARLVYRAAGALAVICAAAATVTWAAGRPNLAQALLEPNPVLSLVWGTPTAYRNLPPVEELSIIGPRTRQLTPRERPRNVILIVLESTPAGAVAAYNPEATAGRRLFTQYANDVTVFDPVFAVSPNSVSSLLSVLTGWSPIPSNAEAVRAAASRPTLAETLKSRGWRNEFLLSGPSDGAIDALVSRGFDRALDMHSPWPRKASHARMAWGYDDRLIFDEARAFIAAQKPDSPPFFLMLHASNPHHPYSSGMVPGLADHPEEKVRHRRLLDHLFEQVTDFYGALKTSGVAETTAVIAYGDHGEAFGEHDANYIHAKELYRENVHVPLLLLHPRRLGLPARIDQLGSLDDIMPTILDLANIPAPPGSGMSLLHAAPARSIVLTTDWGPGQVGFRDRRFFYSLSRTGRERLFDYLADPLERHDIKGQHPDIVNGFRQRLSRVRPGS